MRRSVVIFAVLAALALPAATVRAQGRVSVDFKDASLEEVLSELEEAVGRRVALSPELRSGERVSIKVHDQSMEDVLTKLLSPLGYHWTYQTAGLESQGIYAGSVLVVQAVKPGSPAARAGVKPGDIIRTVNGYAVANRVQASDAITRSRAGAETGRARLGISRRATELSERIETTLQE